MSYYKTQLLSQEPNYKAISLTRPEGILFLVSLMMLPAGKFRSILQEGLHLNSFYSTYLAVLSINLLVSNRWRNSFIYTLIQSAGFFTKGKETNSACCVRLLPGILKVKIDTCWKIYSLCGMSIRFTHSGHGAQNSWCINDFPLL